MGDGFGQMGRTPGLLRGKPVLNANESQDLAAVWRNDDGLLITLIPAFGFIGRE